jgi:pilus assembly protein CpaF
MSLRDRLRRRTERVEPQESAASLDVVVDVPPMSPSDSEAAFLESLETPPSQRAPRGKPEQTGLGTLGFSGEHAAEPLSAVEQLKVDLHRQLIDRLDLEALERISDEAELTKQIRDAVLEFLRAESTPLSQRERDEVVDQVIYEITGLGPIEPLMRDSTISDILVNNARDVYVERRGKLTRVDAVFRNDAHLIAVIDRIVSRVGRRVDESSPMVDARLPDGSRVNAIIPPLALDGPVLSIRRFGAGLSMHELLANGALSAGMATFLAGCVRARLNIIVSGGTGAGKTTLLNALSAFIPATERLITIEDAAELRLQQEHVVRLETRPPNVEGRGEVAARDLVRNALRMRPNRIIIGEVRGAEAVDMLQAMNTGHEGSLATIHANSPRDAIARLETMVLMSSANLPMKAIREQIASTLDLIVQVNRQADGSRRITSITEVVGVETDTVVTRELFEFKQRGVADGTVVGSFRATGLHVAASISERLAIAGVQLPPTVFDNNDDERDDARRTTAAVIPDKEWGSVVESISQAQANGGVVRALQNALAEERRAAAELQRRLDAAERVAARPAPLGEAAVTMLGFIESIDELARAGESSSDPAERDRAAQLRKRATALAAALGLQEIAATNVPVNDTEHDVLRTVTLADRPPHSVVEIVQRGFRLNDRVVRRAQVNATAG